MQYKSPLDKSKINFYKALNNSFRDLQTDVQKNQNTSPNSEEAKIFIDFVNFMKEEGNQYFYSKQYQKALSKYNSALNLISISHPSELYINLLSNRAVTYLQLIDYIGCIRDCTFILIDHENHEKALFRRAIAYLEIGFFDLAKKDLEKISENSEVKYYKNILHNYSTPVSLEIQRLAAILESCQFSDFKEQTIELIAKTLNYLSIYKNWKKNRLAKWLIQFQDSLFEEFLTDEKFAAFMKVLISNWKIEEVVNFFKELEKYGKENNFVDWDWQYEWEELSIFLKNLTQNWHEELKRKLLILLTKGWDKSVVYEIECELFPEILKQRNRKRQQLWVQYYNDELLAIKNNKKSFQGNEGRGIEFNSEKVHHDPNASDVGESDIIRLHAVATAHQNRQVLSHIEDCIPVNISYNQGATPLHCYARSGRYLVVEFLIDRGVTVNSVDDEGNTPLDIVYQCKRIAKYDKPVDKQYVQWLQKTEQILKSRGGISQQQ